MERMPVTQAIHARLAAWSLAAMLLAALTSTPAFADEPMNLAPEAIVSDQVLQGWLKEADAYFSDARYLAAALKYGETAAAGAETPAGQAAEFKLGVALYKLNLNYPAYVRFEAIVDQGADHPYYAKTLPYLLKIARRTGSDPTVLLKISEFPPEVYDAAEADELHFLVGSYFYGESSMSDALTRFQQITQRSPEFFVRAKYLEGVIHVAQSGLGNESRELSAEKLTQAAEAFKAILRHQRDVNTNPVIDQVAEKAKLALGRLFYSTRQYDVSAKYYGEIPEESPLWLESVYESSWVTYQLKDYPRALGNLHGLNSPFFADQYFPESRVLQALILFYNCRYDASDAVVKAFINDYYPLMQRLKKEINLFADPNAFYFWLAKLSKSTDSEFSTRFKRIFNAALADKKLRRKFDLVARLTREEKLIDQLAGPAGAKDGLLGSLKAELVGYRSLVIGETGSVAQARLLRVLQDLKQHLAGALKIKGETLKAKRNDSADSVLKEQAAAAAAKREIVVDSEHIEWPDTGEYWKDELGSYLYDIESRCQFDQ